MARPVGSKKYLLSTKDLTIRNNLSKLNTRLMKQYKDGHTTFASVSIGEDFIKCINVGDSKIFFYKDRILTQVSKDDTYYEYLKSINDNRYLKYEDSHIITACMGSDAFSKKELHISTFKKDLNKSDYIVLCSDGITDMIGKEKLEYCLSLDESLEVKLDKIEKKVHFKGARDNYTLVVIEF